MSKTDDMRAMREQNWRARNSVPVAKRVPSVPPATTVSPVAAAPAPTVTHAPAPQAVVTPGKPDSTLVRVWARNNGYTVGDRGRMSSEIYVAYNAAHS